MTGVLLVNPVQQFSDANGKPYAGGTIATYVAGTSTPKQTWVNPAQTALNTNPIVLDGAGRCLMYGDGDYRLVLNDAAGNLIFDQPASTVISAAMLPVVSAPTIADAANLLGFTAAIGAEAAARAAADSAEATARHDVDLAELNARTAADSNLQGQIDAINAAIAALPTAGQSPQWGYAYSDSDGHKRITYGAAFPAGSIAVVQVENATYSILDTAVLSDATGFDVWFAYPSTSTGTSPAGVQEFTWMAMGS